VSRESDPIIVSQPGLAERSADELTLVQRYREHGDEAAREELIERFLPLARRLAGRYRRGSESIEDLIQVASVGLVKAIERFDPERGSSLSSFAVPTMLGELRRHFRDHGWSIHMPRDLQERVLSVDRAVEKLTTELGHPPGMEHLTERLGLSEEEVLEAMEAASAAGTLSLDAPIKGDEGARAPVSETVGAEDPNYEVAEYGSAISGEIERLSDRDRLVLHLRFVEDMTQSQIAERVGVSQMHVSRILRGALRRLREAAGEDHDD
jgi:RNA polymerase sigma-B factor